MLAVFKLFCVRRYKFRIICNIKKIFLTVVYNTNLHVFILFDNVFIFFVQFKKYHYSINVNQEVNDCLSNLYTFYLDQKFRQSTHADLFLGRYS